MKKNIFFSLIFLGFFTAGFFLQGNKKTSVALAAPETQTQCIGNALAKYFSSIQTGVKASNLANIRILAPAFNLTNPLEKEIWAAMKIAATEYFKPLNYPNFYGFSGNTYTVDNHQALYYITSQNWQGDMWGSFPGTSMIITEYGDFDTKYLNDRPTYPRIGLNQSDPGQIRTTMNDDITSLTSLGGVTGALFFNSLAPSHGYTNPEFAVHNLSDDFYQSVVGGNTEAGINSGRVTSGEAFPNTINSAGLTAGWALEIITDPGNLDAAVRFVNASHANNINPILRTCYGDSCGFADPQVYVSFLQALNQKITGPVWIIAGPNEPMTEHWAAPECSPTVPPFELGKVACDATIEPEFHSLRPYPTNPCNQTKEQSYYICGQDLVVKNVYEFRDGEGDCETIVNGDGSQTKHCKYHVINSSSEVALGLADSYFPIMGNTEKVPNSTNYQETYNTRNGINFLQRVNEYVSWYLNGVTWRAEEQPEDVNLPPFPGNPETIRRVIDFSGPLKKLLPKQIQTNERVNENDRIGSSRHDQIVTCGDTDNPQQCYSNSNQYDRISGVIGDTTSKAFPYVPFSSTEDRIGEAQSILNYGAPSCASGIPTTDATGIICIDYKEDNATRDLYFAHIDEDNELGAMLQNTYKPRDVVGSPAPDDQLREQNATPYCELLESRTNPGDKLYGELVRPGDTAAKPISGTLTYSANFECDFRVPSPDEVNLCIANTCEGLLGDNYNQCVADCQSTNDSCQREVYVPLAVHIATPDLYMAWDRFVAGGMSIVKRIFPQIGEGTPIEELKDIPGDSPANYKSSYIGGNIAPISEGTLAGNPAEQRPGSTAKIYFPHIGSISDYFLKGIQKALRPKDITEKPTVPVIPPPSCSIANSGIRSQALLTLIGNAATWAHVPVEVLTTVVRIEGSCKDSTDRGLCALGDAEVMQYSAPGAKYGPNCSTGGPLQFFSSTWNVWKNAVVMGTGENRVPEICNIKDSIYAGAYALSATMGNGSHCAQAGYNVSQTPAANAWSETDRQWAVTRWAGGCSIGLCGAPNGLNGTTAEAFAATYCNYLDLYSSNITTSCN